MFRMYSVRCFVVTAFNFGVSFFRSSGFSVQGVAVPGAHAPITLPEFPKVLVAM